MSTLRALNGTYRTLDGIVKYIASNEEHNDLVLAYRAVGADPFRATRDMLLVKAAYNKRGGNEYVQIIVSLMEVEIICQDDVARFQSASRAIADMMFNNYCCQIAYAVHGNTDNLHAHFVINSVRYVDGYKLQLGKKELFQLKTIVSDILNQYGFSRLLYYSADENLEN